MPKYKSGYRPDLDALVADKVGVGGIFSTREAESRGISRQLLSYHEKHDRLIRLRQGVYKPKIFPISPFDHIFAASTAAGMVVAGPSALAVHQIGHLESEKIWLRPAEGRSTEPRPHGTLVIEVPVAAAKLIDIGGVMAESVEEAINTVIASGRYDDDQIAEVTEEAAARGLV